MKRFVSLATLLILVALPCFATTVERLSLDDMVKKAQSIVHGRVRDARVHWSADGRLIQTTYTIDVDETLKGQAAKSVELTTIGGKIGDLTVIAAGMPSFAVGEESVVFIEKSENVSTVVGLSQGKFSVKDGEVANTVNDLAFPDGRPGAPLRMRLQDFKRQIENRLR
jgi:hypothetical protein